MANQSVDQPYADLKLDLNINCSFVALTMLRERLQFAKKRANPLVNNGRPPAFSDASYHRILAVVKQLDHGCETLDNFFDSSKTLIMLHKRLRSAKKIAHPLVDNGQLPDFSDDIYLRVLAVVEQLDHACEILNKFFERISHFQAV